MIKRLFKFILRVSIILIAAAVIIFGIPRLVTELYARGKLHVVENAPKTRVAIVFGAGLTRDGSPTIVLRDRVTTAVNLYKSGKVDKLLMSGDNRFIYYNEPGAMMSYAISLGVPRDDIVLDYAGRRTYDTCYRARHIFGVTEAVLVTQRFHLPRALFTCNSLGIHASGVLADQRTYRKSALVAWNVREVPATFMALVDVWLRRPVPVLGKPEPIYPINDAAQPAEIRLN